ncbi:hypothetical protein BDQ17DRAFT_1345604 [Cyathus striatus]|nr:hypothetical protein BDQ17DRAFT_1345604 [Cyathus striatus]
MSWFEATPAESHEDSGHTDANFTHVGEPELSISKPGRKKGASPRKAPPGSKPKGKPGPKPKSALPTPLIAPEDFGSVASEAPTAPSSPATQQIEMSPEPEAPLADIPEPPQSAEKPDLENVAVPQYPLPTKPFPVQLPPKINSGFAPPMPLDKSGKKVRHWRTANREIRGIAGGRWFARTWVGEKESEYSTAVATAQALRTGGDEKNGTLMSKMPLASISAPPGTGAGRGKRSAKAASASLTASAAPSRSGSIGPDLGPGIPITSKPHVPTKMRVLHIPPESSPVDTPPTTAEAAQDVEMAPPPSE